MKKSQKLKILHLSRAPEKIDLDKGLRGLSEDLFEIDDTSRAILTLLGKKEDPLTQNLLSNHISKVTRWSVRRHIFDPNGLLENKFLYTSPASKHKTETTRKFFSLTFKGFVASLAKMNFEENILIKFHHKGLVQESNQMTADLAIQYMKYNLTLILLWHRINGIKLTFIQDLESYFSFFNQFHLYDKIPFTVEDTMNISQFDLYSVIRRQFLALQISLARILQRIEKNDRTELYEEPILNKKIHLYKSNTSLYSGIRHWIVSLPFSQYLHPNRIPKIIGMTRGNVIDIRTSELQSTLILRKMNFIKFKRHPIVIL